MQRIYQEIRSLINAVIVLLIIRTFIIQPFVIPSGSMYPTMEIGDFLVVSKYSLGYSNYSFPFAPSLFEGRVWADLPERGQVMVFRNPKKNTASLMQKITFQDDSQDYIKRLIGLPGDRIKMVKGVLHINGEAVKLKRVEDYLYQDPRNKTVQSMEQYEETLPNGKTYKILKDYPFGQGYRDDTPEFIVPEGYYFFMGDNRDHSADSRDMETLGFVPYEHLIGPARLIFFSTSARWTEVGNYLSGIRFSRLMKTIS